MNLTACGLLTLACAASNIVQFNKIKSNDVSLVVFTVATEETDGYKRFIRSAQLHGINVTVLGLGEKWRGGDVTKNPGGGHKINLLRKGMESIKNSSNTLVMFVDSYDVVFSAGGEEIVNSFKKFDANVVFSAEGFCWPDDSLQHLYPEVKSNEKRFLNSGGFIGYAPSLYSMLSTSHVEDEDDDQLYYTNIFLNKSLKSEYTIKLDTRSKIFQNLNGALDEISVKFRDSTGFIYNKISGTTPLVIHGNGPIKVEFNTLSNYLSSHWTPKSGCLHCDEGMISLEKVKKEDLPKVFVAIFVELITPFLEDFFNNFHKINYPKDRMHLFLHNAHSHHEQDVTDFLKKSGSQYQSLDVHNSQSGLNDLTARNLAVEAFFGKECQYFLSLDGNVQIENPNIIKHLIETNRSMIAPLVSRPGGVWSNYWGAIAENGYYKRSDDYHEILNGKRRGIWNVPYITSIYMVQAHRMKFLHQAYTLNNLDSDMAICQRQRDLGAFMYLDNQRYYGHLVNYENYPTEHLHNDLYSIIENQYTWTMKYIHKDFNKVLTVTPLESIEQPCTDVFWLPMVTPIFCKHMIEEMENYGRWSSGQNEDARIEGGYENVPTIDIHFNQIGWDKQWLHFLKQFIVPLSAKLFEGYESPGEATVNFVVRYRVEDQNKLAPHNDASTYTINMALNRYNIDYQGGGTRFVRYNCSVVKHRLGWMLVHPGRLTHYHEGLPTTGGKRYILVSFIDP